MTLRQVRRLQEVYRWDNCLHLSKRGKPNNFKLKCPQTSGIPGWLCLTRDERGDAIGFLISRRENPKIIKVSCVMDERCFEDTIIRVEYTSTSIYLADIWMWNARVLFGITKFSYRQELLERVFSLYTPCSCFESHSFFLRSNVSGGIRGYEYYCDTIGERGIFMEETKEDDAFEIKATDVPDVYQLSNGEYLRVRTITLSKDLRSRGKTFTLKCRRNEDGTWSPVELSHLNTNGTNEKT